VKPLASKAHGPGWLHCNACRELFTVRVGSVMERGHIPLTRVLFVVQHPHGGIAESKPSQFMGS